MPALADKKNKRRATKVVALAAALVVAGGAAFAWWTAGGAGTGSAATGNVTGDHRQPDQPDRRPVPGWPGADPERHLHQPQQRPGLRRPSDRRDRPPVEAGGARSRTCDAADFALSSPTATGAEVPRDRQWQLGRARPSRSTTAGGQPGQLQGRHASRSSTPAADRATRSGPARRAARVTGPERTSHETPTNRGDVRRTARAAGGAARALPVGGLSARVASLRRASVRAARRHPGGARPAAAPPRRQGEGHRCGPRSAQPGHVGADRAQLPEPEQAPGPDEPRPGQDLRNHRAHTRTPRIRAPRRTSRSGRCRGRPSSGCPPEAPPTWPPCACRSDLAIAEDAQPAPEPGRLQGRRDQAEVQGAGAGGERGVDELQAQAVPLALLLTAADVAGGGVAAAYWSTTGGGSATAATASTSALTLRRRRRPRSSTPADRRAWS